MKETAKRIIALLLVLAMSVSACPMEALAAETSELAVSSAETSAEAEPTEEAEASTEAPAEEDAFTETPAEEEAPADESTEKDASTETSAEKSTEEISSAEHKSTETFSEEVAEGEASAQCDTAQEETDISDCEQQYYDLINGIDLTEEDAEDQFLALKEEIDALKAEASEYLAVPSEESELLTASDTSDSSLITGNCGDNITWTMNEAQTTLYIEGTGDFVAPRKNIWGQSLYYWTGSSTLETVVIGEGITDIGEFNFAQCSKLSSVSIPNTVTTIRIDAFCGTKSLKKLEIPDSVTSVRKAFCGCTGLTDISLPDTITSVRAAFQNCYSLTNIDFLPDSVTDISGAFINCTSLESVQFPAGVTSIANNTTDYDDIVEDVYANNIKKGGAFQGCTALKTIDFGDNITEIGYKAFYDCDSLSTVRLSDSITTIGNLAFGSCAKLGVIVIPDSVTSMGKYVFQDCPQLNTAGPIYSGGVYEISYDIQFGWKTEIPSYAFSNSGIYKIELPDTITKIDSYAFSGCSKLKRMYLPDSLISAGDDAFSGTAITGIRVPGTVTSIDFDSCKKLTDIIFEEKDSTNEEWSLSLSFNYVTATAYYPAGDAAWKNVVNRDYGENADITWKPLTKTEATDTLNEKDSILNGSGTAAARFYLCDEDGMSLPLEIFSYTYTLDGTTYEVTNCQTNIYGGYDFEAPTTLTYDSDADNAEDYVFTVTLENSETKLLHDTYTIHAQVTPLVYKEKWTFALGISGGAGAGELSHTSAAIIVLNHKSDGTQDLRKR